LNESIIQFNYSNANINLTENYTNYENILELNSPIINPKKNILLLTNYLGKQLDSINENIISFSYNNVLLKEEESNQGNKNVLYDSKNIALSTSTLKEFNNENINCSDYKDNNEKTIFAKTTNDNQIISKTNPNSNSENKKNLDKKNKKK